MYVHFSLGCQSDYNCQHVSLPHCDKEQSICVECLKDCNCLKEGEICSEDHKCVKKCDNEDEKEELILSEVPIHAPGAILTTNEDPDAILTTTEDPNAILTTTEDPKVILTSTEDPNECTDDKDCESSLVCNDLIIPHRCAKTKCQNNADCELNLPVCLENECQPCTESSDCPVDYTCLHGQCQLQECLVDSDCGYDHLICDNSTSIQKCVNKPCETYADCNGESKCIYGICLTSCKNDSDCLPGGREACRGGHCKPNECGNAAELLNGRITEGNK